MRVLLAGADEESLTRTAYPAFTAAGWDVAAVVSDQERLTRLAAALGAEGLAVVEGGLYLTPQEAVEALGALPTRVAVVLPAAWEGERGQFVGLPNLIAGFTAPVPWAQVVMELKQRGSSSPVASAPVAQPAQAAPAAQPAQPEPSPVVVSRQPALRRLVAVWSGPMGGSGRTTLALLLALRAAERGVGTLLLALAEPAVSVLLRLGRTPNATAFFESGNLAAAMQAVAFPTPTGRARLQVVLGPARVRDGAVERERIAGLVEAARAASDLVVADLPASVPGGNPWALEPLRQANDVLLVLGPTGLGVTAAVESLATLRDLEAVGRVRLALNRRAATGGLSVQEFVAGVTAVWGDCPPIVAAVPFVAGLPGGLDNGELSEDRRLAEAVEHLAEAALGLPRPVQERRAEGETRRGGDGERQRRRLISIEVI